MNVCETVLHVAVTGNLFVVIAITLERHLQHVANYLVASLAVADLLVAALVMPLAAINEVAVKWFLGSAVGTSFNVCTYLSTIIMCNIINVQCTHTYHNHVQYSTKSNGTHKRAIGFQVCDMWIAADVLCCTSSILHLVAIALDRYMSITRLSYVRRRSSGNVLGFVTVIWLLSAAVSIPPLIGWKDEGGSSTLQVTGRCTISQDLGYTVYSTSAAFYLPLVAIVVIYAKIYRAAQSTIRKKKFRHKRSLMLRQQREQQQQQIDCVDTNGGVPALTLTRETGSVAHAIDVNDDPESTVSLAPTNSCYTYSNDADGYDVGGQPGGASGSSEGRGSSDPDPDSCYAGMNDDGCYSSGSLPGTPPHQPLLVEAPRGHNLQAINTILVHTKQGTVFAASFLHRPSVAMDDVTAAVVRHEAAILEQQSLLHTPPLHHHHPAVAHRHISAGSKNDEHIRLVVLDRKDRAAACKPAKALKGNGAAHGGPKAGGATAGAPRPSR
jgi:hypothetical protein